MAKLFFRYSAMNAGKSLDLLKTCFNYEERDQNVLLLTSALDNRYGINKIKSRIGIERDAISICDDTNIIDVFKNSDKKIDCILCDEVQFFKKHHIFELSDIVDNYDIPVICYGLRSDYKLEAFEGSIYLMVIADEIEELKTICHCGKKATVNARIVNGKIITDGEQIIIGGNESYISLCRKCFKLNKIEK
jgi:thymidine kinase